MENTLSSTLYGLVIAGLMYTVVGFVAGLIWAAIAPATGLPALGILVVLGLWWLWALFFAPPIIFFVSTFRATDPLKGLTDMKRSAQAEQDQDQME